MEKKRIAPDISSFEQLREGDKLYVDKTEYIWELVKTAPAEYFLSRPRRFGKSLTLTTLKAVFEGKKELFEGLAIHDKPYDWKAYPVIHLDMGNCNSSTGQELEAFLQDRITALAAQLDVSC
ncbi:MAG: AAA family ATPase, partial [Lentisphaeria bacterium]|nr:AAA family ATPase [Lentisphaeria bacterium]